MLYIQTVATQFAGRNEAKRDILRRGSTQSVSKREAECKGARHTKQGLIPWEEARAGS